MTYERNSWNLRGGALHGNVRFSQLASLAHLFACWKEFIKDKEKRVDVQQFALDLEDNVFNLHRRLISGSYRHGGYQEFFVCDPKLRHIHKASVEDRVLHHAVTKMISPVLENSFIYDLYSNRKQKGTHRAFKRMQKLAWQLSHNNTKTVWVLKCDIRKFFDEMDHQILLSLIEKKIKDPQLMSLITGIIESFETYPGKGLPLGNLTSQLFSNVYLDPLDHWVTCIKQTGNYVRYVDDFLLLSQSRRDLVELLGQLKVYLSERLKIRLHPQKIVLRPWHQGIDFLGYVGFPYYSVLRTKTAQRMLRKVSRLDLQGANNRRDLQTYASYLGSLSHCRAHGLYKAIEEVAWSKTC